MTRREMTALISQSELPMQARVMGCLFVASASDEQIEALGQKAQIILAQVKDSNIEGFTQSLNDMGKSLSPELRPVFDKLIAFLVTRAFGIKDNTPPVKAITPARSYDDWEEYVGEDDQDY